MAHLHELRDTDTHFVIDPVTRTISNANDAKNKLMQYDHNSEIMTFEIPQYVDGHDMSQCDKVEVHYINIDSKTKDQSKDVFPCKAAAKTDNDIVFTLEDGKLIFCWKVSGNATVYSGSLNFLVRFACIDDEGKICYKWHTDIFKGITISGGINNTEAVAETYSDVLEQWKKELEDAAGSGSGTASLADWVKQPEPPKYTAEDVGADTLGTADKLIKEHDESDTAHPAISQAIAKIAADVGGKEASGTAESKVSAHNTATDAHNDIRLLVQGLAERLNALADSDDTTLDQMSEVVTYIKSNKSLIDAITTNKVNVSDIIDNLTTNVSNKPLSASQGVALKALIDAIVVPTKLSELENDGGYAKTTDIPDTLPNPQKLTFAGAVTAEYDGSGEVTVTIPEGGGSSDSGFANYTVLKNETIETDDSGITEIVYSDLDLSNYNDIVIFFDRTQNSNNTSGNTKITVKNIGYLLFVNLDIGGTRDSYRSVLMRILNMGNDNVAVFSSVANNQQNNPANLTCNGIYPMNSVERDEYRNKFEISFSKTYIGTINIMIFAK